MSGILDSFFFFFGTNAKQAQKDTDAFGKSVDNTQNRLNSADKSAQQLGLSFSKLALAGVAALEGFASLGKLKDGIVNAINYNAEIEKAAKLTNINARELAIWNGVVAHAGGNPGSKDYLSFITKLNQQYAGLGVNQRIRNVNRDLGELADRIKALNDSSPGSGYAFAQRFGIGDDLYLALKNGKGALQDLINEQSRLNNTTEESSALALELKQQWQSVGTTWQSAFTGAIPLAQIFLGIMDGLANFTHIVLDLFTLSGWKDLANTYFNFSGKGGNATPQAGDTSSPYDPRGIRNNNPGNLRFAGQAGATNNNGFAQFGTLAEGTAAEQRQLQIYGNRGVNTLAGIASRWAPSGENNTPAYLAGLSRTTGFDPNEKLNLNDPSVRARVANAINVQEEGSKYGNLIGTAQGSIAGANGVGVGGGAGKSLTIGHITINTQATDAKGIAADMRGELSKQYATTVGSVDDGIAY